jgi:hypothetical protein
MTVDTFFFFKANGRSIKSRDKPILSWFIRSCGQVFVEHLLRARIVPNLPY